MENRNYIKYAGVLVVIVLLFTTVAPIVSASVPIRPPGEVGTGTSVSTTQITLRRFIPPQPDEPEILDINMEIDGNADGDWEEAEELPQPGDFGSIPLFSVMWTDGLYRIFESGGDLELTGLRVWIAFRFALLNPHTCSLQGTAYYHMGGHVTPQEVSVNVAWSPWYPFCGLVRIKGIPLADVGVPNAITKIHIEMDFFEDGRFIWHYSKDIL